MRIDRGLKEAVQLQVLPKFQTQIAGAELPGSLQPYSIQQHACDLGVVGRRFDMRGEKLQLLYLALVVEYLDGLRPASLCRRVQFP